MELKQGKRFWGALAVAFAVMGLGAGFVLAHTNEYETVLEDYTTTEQTGPSPGGFKADIGSDKAPCVPSRSVRLIRDNDSKVIKTDKTNDAGKARILFPQGLALGTYYLSVKRSDLNKPGHKHTCGRAETPPTMFQFDPAE